MVTKHKKAEGMSINVIIIAIMALIVLIVVVMIFTGKMNAVIPNLNQENCKQRGGYCKASVSECNPGDIPAYGMGCPGTGQEKTDKKVYCCYLKPQ